MEPTRHLSSYFRSISNAMAQSMQQNVEGMGLTSTQGMFLHHLWFCQQIQKRTTYARDLEQFFDIKHPTVSGILRRMEAADFVTFVPNSDDHRCKAITLTQKALDAHAQIQSHIEAEEARLVTHMTADDVQQLRRLLQQAAENLGVCMLPHHSQKEESNP